MLDHFIILVLEPLCFRLSGLEMSPYGLGFRDGEGRRYGHAIFVLWRRWYLFLSIDSVLVVGQSFECDILSLSGAA